MKDIFIKNGIYGNHHNLRLDTVDLENFHYNHSSIKIPNLHFDTAKDTVEYSILIKRNKFFNLQNNSYCYSDDFRVEIEFKSWQLIKMNFISVIYLSNNINQCLLSGSALYHTGGYRSYIVWPELKIKDLKKFKLKDEEIFLNLNIASITKIDSELNSFFNAEDYKIEYSTDYCCDITSNFANCFIEENLIPDAILISKNKEFKIHKNIFSARSDYFSAIFKHETTEKQSNRVLIKNKNGDLYDDAVVQEMIRYIYTGTVKNLDLVAFELFKLAHMYNLPILLNICTEYLKNNISAENTVSLLKLSKEFDQKELKTKISNFFKRQHTFIVEALFFIPTKLWNHEQHEIESNVIKTRDKHGNNYEFKFRIKKELNAYCLSLEFLSQNMDAFSTKLIFRLCRSTGDTIDSIKFINISPNTTVESPFPCKIFEDEQLVSLLFNNDKLFLHVFIFEQSVENEKSINFSSLPYLKKNEEIHDCKVLKDVATLYNNPTFSDFKIKTVNQEFYVHKNILATNSSTFFSNLKNMKEKCSDDCLFIDEGSEVVEAMLNYIYGGSTDKFCEFALELYLLAEKYGFKRLRQKCIPYLD